MNAASALNGEILPPLSGDVFQRLQRLRRLAWFLDAALRIPGTKYRMGADALIGLLPVGGTVVMTVLSLLFVWEGWRLKAPTGLLAKMLVNIALEAAFDLVPVLGNLVDIAFKANLRNIDLLEQYFGVVRR
ncbi:DUF4112 domain-containing protein [Acetobacter sicerae]|uniref:DUF4112 domain-containing protein n=1 Tax=Acetobacter sicerae TaxID=85325 RepID=UPI001886EFDE|nr:DUF4112 domain-containing protein [Acetobacter sicerae]